MCRYGNRHDTIIAGAMADMQSARRRLGELCLFALSRLQMRLATSPTCNRLQYACDAHEDETLPAQWHKDKAPSPVVYQS